ncbi:MAG: DsrE family protein [Candidatus Brocadiales bacterium]
MTNIVVIIHKTPFNTLRNSEGLRMSVGLTLEDDNKVTALFINDGVHLLRKTNPELVQSGIIYKHLDTLRLLGHRVVADKESLEERGCCIDELGTEVDILPRQQIVGTITDADRVIPWQ